jgi:EAL domain-containing protein (putative c-di-GMP-specific phosphodiesterase class I)
VREWHDQGLGGLRMSVNVSARQFQHPGFIEMVARVLGDTGVAPALIELELTESMLNVGPETALDTLKALKALGVRLAIDDFGTGLSSLDRLKRLPIDFLKIDGRLVAELPGSERERAVVSAIGAFGKALGIAVVAEGVETQAQAAFLAGTEVGEMQGYHFCRPVPAEQALEYCQRGDGSRGRAVAGRSGAPDAGLGVAALGA